MNLKNKNRRLRKKLRLGEFKEWGSQFDAKLKSLSEESMNAFFEAWIGFVIEQGWQFGGGCSPDSLSGFLTKPDRKSMTETDIELTRKWLTARSEVDKVNFDPLCDAWY